MLTAGPRSKRRQIKVGIEHLPREIFECSADWSGLAITRLLAEPLFVEVPDRGLQSRLISKCNRLDAHTWRLVIDRHAAWDNGLNLTSREICNQIGRARKTLKTPACGAGLLGCISLVSDNVLDLKTRLPIAHVDRVLANPGLAPREDGRSTGPYLVGRRTERSLILQSAHSNDRIDLSVARPSERVDLFDAKQVDIDGPMSIPPSRWRKASTSIEARRYPLDIVYALVLPQTISVELGREIQSNLDRAGICRNSNGSVMPRKQRSEVWFPIEESDLNLSVGELDRQSIQRPTNDLLYSDFPGNREIAESTARHLRDNWGIALRPLPTKYDTLHLPVASACSFRIVLIASPWPHPAAMLAPYFYSNDVSQSFKELFSKAMAAEDLNEAAVRACEAESQLLADDFKLVVLGQVVGCIRSRIGTLWCPPSAWLDYSVLHSGVK